MRTLPLFLLLAGCGIPRDIEGTSERIAATRVVRVGWDGGDAATARPFLDRLTGATGARLSFRRAPLEQLVHELDHDRLDVIVVPVRPDAALADEVALTDPLAGPTAEDRPVALRAAVRNGENRWLMTVEQAARGGAR